MLKRKCPSFQNHKQFTHQRVFSFSSFPPLLKWIKLPLEQNFRISFLQKKTLKGNNVFHIILIPYLKIFSCFLNQGYMYFLFCFLCRIFEMLLQYDIIKVLFHSKEKKPHIMQHFNNMRQFSMSGTSQSKAQFWCKGFARGHLRTVYYKNKAEMTHSGKRCGSQPWSWKFFINSQFQLWGMKEGRLRRGGEMSSCLQVRGLNAYYFIAGHRAEQNAES